MKQLLLFIFLSVVGVGCYKELPTVANIHVVRIDESGNEIPVNNAEVRLYSYGSGQGGGFSTPRFDITQNTTANGQTTFNFTEYYKPGQSGFAVLDIEVIKGNLHGEDLIEIVEMEINEKKVIVE